MGGTRQYNREEILEKITDLFWEKGFEGISINEAVARTGVNKFSLYNEFGDKEKLFLSCIDHYISNSCDLLVKILSKKPLGLSNIKFFLITE